MISGAGAMNPVCPREDGRLEWGNGVVSILFDTAGDSPSDCATLQAAAWGPSAAVLPTMEEPCWNVIRVRSSKCVPPTPDRRTIASP